MLRNQSGQQFKVFAFNRTTNVPVTGDAANITCKISKDYATAVATDTTNPTEIEDGYYYYPVTQAESNCTRLDPFPESSTANVQVISVPGTIYPDILEANQAAILALVSTATITVSNPVITATVIQLDEGDTYDGTSRDKLSFTVSKDYSSFAYTVELNIWRCHDDGTRTLMLNADADVVSSTLITVSLTATFLSALSLTGCPAFERLNFALVGTTGGNEETITKGDCYVYGRE